MSASEKFSLRWNDFESSISSNIGKLRDAQDFLDVTLVCENDQIRAHKLVISACSPFFRNILNKNPHQNPLLYMKGVKLSDMESVLDFMYYGEVSIYQNDLNSFLAVAEDLQVKGLTQKNTPKDSSETSQTLKTVSPEENYPRKSSPNKFKNYHKAEPSDNGFKSYQSQSSSIKVKSEIIDVSQEHQQQGNSNALVTEYAGDEEYNEDAYDNYEDDTSYDDNNQTLDLSRTGIAAAEDLSQYIINDSDPSIKEYTCALCQTFKAKLPSKVKNHLEAIHFPGLFLYNCDICGKTLKGRNALNIHKSTTHSKKVVHHMN